MHFPMQCMIYRFSPISGLSISTTTALRKSSFIIRTQKSRSRIEKIKATINDHWGIMEKISSDSNLVQSTLPSHPSSPKDLKANDRNVESVALRTLDKDTAADYRLSDHFKPRKWFNFIGKIVTRVKDWAFIFGKRGEIQDHRLANKELHSKLAALDVEIANISTFINDRKLQLPQNYSGDQKLSNWPEVLASSKTLQRYDLLQASKQLYQRTIGINEKKIEQADQQIKRRSLDPKINSLVKRLSSAEKDREKLNNFFDLQAVTPPKVKMTKTYQRKLIENPAKLNFVTESIERMHQELSELMRQYEGTDPKLS